MLIEAGATSAVCCSRCGLRDILSSPRFDADILNREKNRTIASIKDAMTRPDVVIVPDGADRWIERQPFDYANASPEATRQRLFATRRTDAGLPEFFGDERNQRVLRAARS